MKKAIWIDAENKRVLPFKNTGLESLQGAVKGLIEIGHRFKSGDVIFVDEEGLFKNYRYGFRVRSQGGNPFVGNGVIVGPADDEGDDLDTTLTVEEIEKQIEFLEAL